MICLYWKKYHAWNKTDVDSSILWICIFSFCMYFLGRGVMENGVDEEFDTHLVQPAWCQRESANLQCHQWWPCLLGLFCRVLCGALAIWGTARPRPLLPAAGNIVIYVRWDPETFPQSRQQRAPAKMPASYWMVLGGWWGRYWLSCLTDVSLRIPVSSAEPLSWICTNQEPDGHRYSAYSHGILI